MTAENVHASQMLKRAAPAHTEHPRADDARAPLQVSTLLLRAVADVVQQRGIAPNALFGDDFAALFREPIERAFPLDDFHALLARAARLTNDPAFGLHCGLYASEASFGLMNPLMTHAPTLRRALVLITQFRPLLIEGVSVHVSERLGMVEVRCELVQGPASEHRSFIELMVGGIVRMLRTFGCTRDDIRSVCFEYARPAYAHAYAAAFGGNERYAQAFTGVEFAAQALDRPHLYSHNELHSLMLAQAERNLQRLTRPVSCSERVRTLMRARPPGELPDVTAAARQLGLSERSLRRRLHEEGTSYRELTQALLYETACSMLKNRALTLQSIAHVLGFADSTAFHRAFRRWARVTPADYRAGLARNRA